MSEDRYTANIPRPDPSLLTTIQFDRGQEIQRRELAALREFLSSEMNRIAQVHEEKFKGIDIRFTEAKEALRAALNAASEASEKSEKSFTKQIDALEVQTKTITQAQSSQINEIKEQMNRSEGTTKGGADNTARLMSAAMFVIALVLAFYTMATHSSAVPPPPTVVVQPKGG